MGKLSERTRSVRHEIITAIRGEQILLGQREEVMGLPIALTHSVLPETTTGTPGEQIHLVRQEAATAPPAAQIPLGRPAATSV